jgi:formate dehydrogenase major subunit
MLEEIAQVVPFFEGVTWENLGDNGLQWPVQKGGIDTKILHTETFKRGKGKFHYFDFAESTELVDNAGIIRLFSPPAAISCITTQAP